MKNVLILGCGRSGTSIFGEFFKHLSAYNYYSEPYFDEMLQWDFKKPVAVKVPRESKQFSADNGLSFPLNKLLELIPVSNQFYWQVRNPLDAICSLKVGISKNWGHHPQPPDWRNWLEKPLIVQCAYHWNYINTIGFSQVKGIVKITRFEDMLHDPKSFASSICKDISLNEAGFRDEIESWTKKVHNEDHPDYQEAETSKPYSTDDHRVKIGRWKENMTEKELNLIKPMIKDTASKFGYYLD